MTGDAVSHVPFNLGVSETRPSHVRPATKCEISSTAANARRTMMFSEVHEPVHPPAVRSDVDLDLPLTPLHAEAAKAKGTSGTPGHQAQEGVVDQGERGRVAMWLAARNLGSMLALACRPWFP